MKKRRVFGVKPEDLTECDIPASDEITGSMDLSIEEVKGLSRAISSKNN